MRNMATASVDDATGAATTETTTTLPIIGRLRRARIAPPTRVGLLRGMLLFRWLTWAWLSAVYCWEFFQRNIVEELEPPVAHPVAGFFLVATVLVFNGWLTVAYQKEADLLVRPAPILSEIALATILLMSDVWVYGSTNHSQSLPSVWVVAVVFSTAIAAGQRAAIITAVGLGLARYVGWLPYAEPGDKFFSMARLATIVLLVVAAWTAGYLLKKLEASDRSISAYRAREEVARTLHDGVLQTLAVIQRRSEDGELVELARTQELELREYLFGAAPVDTDLATGLRAAARRAEQRYGIRVEVVTAPDLPRGTPPSIHSLCSAVGEALTNASKHGEADKVVIYAEPGPDALGGLTGLVQNGQVFISIKDDGRGFDDAHVEEGEGLSRSIRGRIVEAGGRVEVDGRLGRGTEVRLWL